MTMVYINNWIEFSPNRGVSVNKEALKASPEELYEAIATAWSHMNDWDLMDACCGCHGPLADVGDIPYEDYLVIKQVLDKSVHQRDVRS
jgi:hypothetical protein